MLYLVSAEINYYRYMGETTEESVLRLVEAETEQEAQEILDKYYEQQSSEYSHTYLVLSCKATPVLSRKDIK